jgi:dihydroorotate dehydrogenase electron transfer subunit
MSGPAILAQPGCDARGTVVANERIAPDAYVLRFEHDQPVLHFQPGQFLQLAAWNQDPLLRRPMSVLDQGTTPAGRTWTSFLYQVVGRGTRIFADLRPGDALRALGPLGNRFRMPARPGPALVVAGGVGVAPFLLLVRALVAAGRETLVLLGARDASRLYLAETLEREGARVLCATERGDRGTQGFVTKLLDAEVAARGAGAIGHVYTCGPEPMMRAVHAYARERELPGEASMERRMACGYGVCFTCTCPMIDARTGAVRNRRTCLDGPVVPFEALPIGGW